MIGNRKTSRDIFSAPINSSTPTTDEDNEMHRRRFPFPMLKHEFNNEEKKNKH